MSGKNNIGDGLSEINIAHQVFDFNQTPTASSYTDPYIDTQYTDTEIDDDLTEIADDETEIADDETEIADDETEIADDFTEESDNSGYYTDDTLINSYSDTSDTSSDTGSSYYKIILQKMDSVRYNKTLTNKEKIEKIKDLLRNY